MIRLRFALLLAPLAWLLAFGGLACGSEESKLDRGIAVDPEVAVPNSAQEDALTAAERQQQEDEEEDARSKARFDEAQKQAE